MSRRDLLRYSGTGLAAASAARMLASGAPASAAGSAGSTAATGRAVALAHVRPRTTAQKALLAHLDDTHVVFDDGSVEVLLWDGDLARLDEVGMDYDVFEPAAESALRPAGLALQPGETANGDYRPSAAAYYQELRDLVAAHAGTRRVRLIEMGPSLLGVTVLAVEIGTGVVDADGNPTRDGRPVVFHDGMQHCREWPSGEMPMMWAHDLLENYGVDPVITRIVDGCRTFVLPLANPDGFDRTREWVAHNNNENIGPAYAMAVAGQGDLWRKNLRAVSTTGPAETLAPTIGGSPVGQQQPDAYGIDLNRNYAFFWGDESGSSSIPTEQTYRGSAPFSEPETHNIRDIVLANLPITHITHHTSGRQMLIPWGRDPDVIRSPDYDLMIGLGEEMRDGYVLDGVARPGNGYDPIQAFNLYPTSGTSRDWAHAATRTIIWTFEHGTVFHGPYPSTVPPMYEVNRWAFIRAAVAAMDPQVHCRITGVVANAPAGTTVALRKSFQTPTNLQVVGTPVISVGGLPAVEDPAGGTVRPTLVDESLERIIDVAPDGSFDLRVPPSTRPFIVNEQLLDEDYETEAYQLVVERPGAAAVTIEVTIDRGEHVDLGTL